MNQLLQGARKSLWLVCLIGVCHGQSFTISVSPASLTIYPGQQNVPVTVTIGNSAYTGPITVTLTGLPSGMYVSPLQLLAGTSGTLNLSASVSAAQEGFPPDGPAPATSWATSVTVVGSAGANQATALLALTVSISNPAFAPAASNIDLPILRIDTANVPIVGANDVAGNMTITSADGETTYLPNASDSDNTATFHVHGQSTAQMPKLPYHVKLNTGVDLLNAMGLQCPYVTNGKGNPACDKSKSFILLANYDDKTLLRDWSASALANAIPIGNGYLNSPADSPSPSGTSALMPWAPHSLFVELYLNGMYEGNYQLIEEVKVDSHRINITELSETDTSAADITGGYLLEIDQHEDEAFVFFTPHNLPIGLIDPDFTPDPEVPAQTNYITNYVDNAETALFASNFTDPTLGWRAYFDETSAINFYIVNDVMGNVDGGDFYSSNYLYKDANNPLLYMGPIWDFDISAGNVNYYAISSPVVPWMQTQAIWYEQWFTDPGFKADLVTQWNTLKKNGVFTNWLTSIQQEAATLQQSQTNNFGRWPMQGLEVWPNPQAGGNYAAEVAYLTNWLSLRIAYLDSLFNNKTQTSIALNTVAAAPRSGSPLSLSAQVSGGNSPTGTVAFLCNSVLLGTAPLSAGGAATLITDSVIAGPASLQAVYSGDTNNALAVSQAQTVAVASPFLSTVTSLGNSSSGASSSTSTGFTASVIANSGTSTPTGTVTFSVDQTAGTAVALNANGTADFTPASLSSGTHTIAASYSGDSNYSGSTGSFSTPTAAVSPSSSFPAVSAVVNAASEAQGLPQVVSPGSYVTIYGSGLAGTGIPAAMSLPLLTTLNGTQVTIGGMAMPLLYAGPAQINALVPQQLAPNASYPMMVTVGSVQSQPLTVTVTELQPGIYTQNLSGSSAGIVTNSLSGILNTSSNPANVGDYLTIYCTGLGALTGANGEAQPSDGAAAPASPLFHTTSTVAATIGGINAAVSFAGLAPAFAGLYQVNLQVPPGVPSGDSVALVLTATDSTTGAAAQSNVVMITIQ
jgi:uncharacterized protein (TIGR03437 family)